MPVLVQTCSQSAPPCTRTTAWASVGKHALNANNHMASHAVQRLCLAGLNMPRMVAEGPHARGAKGKEYTCTAPRLSQIFLTAAFRFKP